MALAIATNNAALQSAAAASSVNREMETSMARLSTGKRINSARDDAAGVAIASRLSSEIRGTDQAIRNAMDGQALIDTAEGGHKEIENILQRMREVAVQSANDTNDASDRANLQAEMDALTTEINRAASVTTWAGQAMMSTGGSSFSFQVGTATGGKNQIGITIGSMAASTLTVGKTSTTAGDVGKSLATASTITFVSTANETSAFTITGTAADGSALSETITALALGVAKTTAGTYKTITSIDSSVPSVGAISIGVTTNGSGTAVAAGVGTIAAGTAAADDIPLTGAELRNATISGDTVTAAAANLATSITIDGIDFKTNSAVASKTVAQLNEDMATLINASEAMQSRGITATNTGSWATLTLKYAEGSDVFLDTAANARAGIAAIDAAIKTVNTQRSELGAVSNRLSHTVNNLTNISSNLSAAKGGIEDADFAFETTNLAKNQILQQASTAMLAQANASKQNVLSLLQG
jgi:flagellin